MNILLIGGDGYIGWPLALRLSEKHPNACITIVDSFLRRKLVKKVGGTSLSPIASLEERIETYQKLHGKDHIRAIEADASKEGSLDKIFEDLKPEVIFHLGHQPSAPYSMMGASECVQTVTNNEISNLNLLWLIRDHCPNAHFIKLGSFGAYATPGIDIPEGYYNPTYNGRSGARAPFPRESDDVYHVTKINDSNFISLACRKWNLRVSDVMQSTVFGLGTTETLRDPSLCTRFDFDAVFGTVLNRFVTKTLAEMPMQIYGSGHQRTGIMPLCDCIDILGSLSTDMPEKGEHRVINNVSEHYSIFELAEIVGSVAKDWNLKSSFEHNQFNPRYENEIQSGEYKIENDFILNKITPTSLKDAVHQTLELLLGLKGNIDTSCMHPKHQW